MNEKERMMVTSQRVIEDMLEVLKHRPEDGLRWESTRQDLMQAIHILYDSMEVRDEYDVPVPYSILVRRVCVILRQTVPKNPSAYVRQGEQCQGMRRQKFLLRYDGEGFIQVMSKK